jgi:hypothetical protein
LSDLKWSVLHGVDQVRLSDARIQAHFAVQWLARGARAYIPGVSDHSHTNLGWDDTFGGLTTRAFSDGARLGLEIANLKLAILDGQSGELLANLSLNGRTDADVRAWLGHSLSERGLDPAALDAPSPYDMPRHAIAEGAAYTVNELGEFLSVLSVWFSNANSMLGAIREQVTADNLNAPPIRCWPHHFDLDTLVSVSSARTMGVGFEPGDGYYDEPYFYASMHPYSDPATLPALPSIGFWHSKDFLAAIAPAHRIVESGDQKADIETFLMAAIRAAIKALS